MNNPVRIQRKRTKGWRMPPNTVYVGRGTMWGNPFKSDDNAKAVDYFKRFLENGTQSFQCGQETGVYLAFIPTWHYSLDLLEALPQLRGKNLACFCPLDKPCHADILLELLNQSETPERSVASKAK
jgi:hypothetical protein